VLEPAARGVVSAGAHRPLLGEWLACWFTRQQVTWASGAGQHGKPSLAWEQTWRTAPTPQGRHARGRLRGASGALTKAPPENNWINLGDLHQR